MDNLQYNKKLFALKELLCSSINKCETLEEIQIQIKIFYLTDYLTQKSIEQIKKEFGTSR